MHPSGANPLYSSSTRDLAPRFDELLQARARLVEEQRSIVSELEELDSLRRRHADGLTGTKQARYEELEARYQELNGELDELERRILRVHDARESRRRQAELELAHRPAPDEHRGGLELSGRHVLGREDSLARWVRDRSGGIDGESRFLAGTGLESDAFDELSFGRIVRAAATGERSGLTEGEARALAEGADSTGGVTVPEVLSSSVIDLARARSVVFQAGALTVPMASDTTVLAKLTGGNSAGWKLENDPVAESDQTWERVELKAKTVVVLQRMSRELFEDASPAGLVAIRNEIAQAIALKLDLAALEGTGVNPEPRGIANTAGVNVVSMGANGAAPTSYAELVKAVFAILGQNGAGATAAVLHPRDGETYALLADSTGQPLARPPAVAELPYLFSTQIATNRDQGTSTDVASNAYVGDFAQMLVGVRPSLQLRFQTLQERYADNLQVGMIAWLRADVVLAHPEHFTTIAGLLAAP